MIKDRESFSHRWSGWPGAWCLDCGISDPNEMCLADGHDPITCKDCPKLIPCLHKGQGLYDPYRSDDND